jgi:hypothetical protein
LRDRDTFQRLSRTLPPIFETDFPWIITQLEGELFTAAGAAEILRLFRRQAAVPALDSALGRPSHPFLKEIVIETLGSLGGDAAEAALLRSLRDDPDDGVRLECAAALGRFSGPETLRSLIQALHDPSLRVRSAASTSLAHLNGTGAVDALLRALGEERDPATQADLIVAAYSLADEPGREVLRRTLPDRPAWGVLQSRTRLHDGSRYERPYDRTFFEPGGAAIPRDPSKPRIGITLEPGLTIAPRELALLLFGAAPLDRYRDWFYFRKADDFPGTAAFDASGNPLGDIPYGDLEGTVFLHFADPASFARGVLGFTRGCHAVVQGVSLLHEFGHAFARLGDEYADGSQEDAPNLFRQAAVPWRPLIASGLLSAPLHRDGTFFIPTENCYLNNTPIQSRYCPVCQLEMHARVAELAGAPLPW